MRLPDYNNCLANLPNSVLKWFGIEDGKNRVSLKMMDEELQNDYQNVVVILLDAMGAQAVEDHFSENSFFAEHLKGTYSTVFPSTTVAATTSAITGLMPCQHGWLGWDMYFPQIDKNVEVFTNRESGTEVEAADFNVAWKFIPYRSVVDIINENGGQAYCVMPFCEPYPATFSDSCNLISDLCKKEGKKYIYAYWPEPDTTMHHEGCRSQRAKEVLAELEQAVKGLHDSVEDTLIIVTADHGQMDSRGAVISDDPELMACLKRKPSIEPRALNFFVKDGMQEIFEKRFLEVFGQEFQLLTKKEVKDRQLFGTEEKHVCFDEMLGDYLAITDKDLTIWNSHQEKDSFIGVHAGLTDAEMRIPFIVIK